VAASDQLICISRATQREVRDFIKKHNMRRPSKQSITWFHLGCDFGESKPSAGVSTGDVRLLRGLAARPSFLMVSTIEPRKGHLQVIKACDILWRRGVIFNLCIVGKVGWNSKIVEKAIRHHRLFKKRLFWVSNASDEYLELLYSKATALLNASEAEGFGLPMVEGARNGIPIIARDIHVNREICGKNATYFRATNAVRLATSLKRWLQAYSEGCLPNSRKISILTWRQSAQQLLRRIENTKQTLIKHVSNQQSRKRKHLSMNEVRVCS
jgi:glycosyltransferase involved in cell wall biosynthesis